LKALSLKQPWATLVIRGLKKFETRSWKTSHRGRLAIVSSKTFPYELKHLCLAEPFRGVIKPPANATPEELQQWYDEEYPIGMLIGTVKLLECHPVAFMQARVSDQERAFGDFGPDRFGWEIVEAKRIVPTAARGSLGLFDVPDLLIPEDAR